MFSYKLVAVLILFVSCSQLANSRALRDDYSDEVAPEEMREDENEMNDFIPEDARGEHPGDLASGLDPAEETDPEIKEDNIDEVLGIEEELKDEGVGSVEESDKENEEDEEKKAKEMSEEEPSGENKKDDDENDEEDSEELDKEVKTDEEEESEKQKNDDSGEDEEEEKDASDEKPSPPRGFYHNVKQYFKGVFSGRR